MPRTSFQLDAETLAWLAQEAKRRGVSQVTVLRVALERERQAQSRGEDPWFSLKKVWRGKAPEDLSAAHDRHLADLDP